MDHVAGSTLAATTALTGPIAFILARALVPAPTTSAVRAYYEMSAQRNRIRRAWPRSLSIGSPLTVTTSLRTE